MNPGDLVQYLGVFGPRVHILKVRTYDDDNQTWTWLTDRLGSKGSGWRLREQALIPMVLTFVGPRTWT